jgi:hypothetical protein
MTPWAVRVMGDPKPEPPKIAAIAPSGVMNLNE